MSALPELYGHRLSAIQGGTDSGEPPIVFLHGFLAAPEVWLPTMPEAIREHRRWFSVSLPAHHPSVCAAWPNAVDFSDAALTRVLAATLQALAPDRRVELVGWSTGGFLALRLAANVPQLVAGVACISGFSRGRWHGPLGLLQKLARRGGAGEWFCRRVLDTLSLSRWLFGAVLQRQLHGCRRRDLDERGRATFDCLRSALPRHDRRRLAVWLGVLRGADIGWQLGKIAAPVSVLSGDHDKIITASESVELARGIPGAEFHLVSGTGHFVFLQNPTYYQQWLTTWLERRETRPSTGPSGPAAAVDRARPSGNGKPAEYRISVAPLGSLTR
jgi:pimeloyl-ACP methyl ester carboxylesterase